MNYGLGRPSKVGFRGWRLVMVLPCGSGSYVRTFEVQQDDLAVDCYAETLKL